MKSFNPYSPGFSIYLLINHAVCGLVESFNPYSPGFSIYFNQAIKESHVITARFNPYSPGFSIYFNWQLATMTKAKLCFNPYSPGFSIYLFEKILYTGGSGRASILIHLDFLSI